jgi:MYXO-CTERM domain-containing protein
MRSQIRPWILALVAGAWIGPGATLDARAALGENSVGMNIHVGWPEFIDAAADLGVGWVRLDANWYQLEPSSGQHQWSGLDAWVDRATAAGLKVFLTLAYTPAWVPRHGDTDGLSHNDCPDASTEWVRFVRAAVARYRARGVTHFGLWNEPNLTSFLECTPAEYATLIASPGAAAVRAECADCKVLGPDLANVGECDVYLEAVLRTIPVSTFDIIAHHIYQGFAETGWAGWWAGDSFMNALDDQRNPWTRRDLRQILDAHGYAGEVWITETGYRADPPGDAAREATQATYVRRVLEEQLARAWVTNSFFYEMCDCKPDQPDCTIDGFGLMRATAGSPSTRSFPADFRLKPAFLFLRQFIADHPEIVGLEPPAQCGDGLDNDGDGRVDMDDRGCRDGQDDDESDDPPRERLEVYRTPGIQLDGELGELGPDGWLALGPQSWRGTTQLGPGDLEVRAAARWSAAGLFLAFDVLDDTHQNDRPQAELWMGDSVQVAFDLGANGGLGYDGTDDHEFAFGLSEGQVRTYRHAGPPGASDDFQAAISRAGGRTRYELRLGPGALPGLVLEAGRVVRCSFLVNDADQAGREGWLEWTPGIGMVKDPEWFGELELLAELSPGGEDGGVDAGDGEVDAGDAGVDAGDEGVDAGDEGVDAGDAGRDAGDGPDEGPAEPEGGCGCGAGSPGSAALPTLLLGLLALRRRRTSSAR